MELIALPDLHGNCDCIGRIAEALASVDLVLLPGDLTTYGYVAEVRRLIETIRQHNPHILAIPGNMDTEQIAGYLTDEGMNIHRRSVTMDGVAFLGVGGALPFAGLYVFGEDDLEVFLDEAGDGLDPALPQILICHQPPVNTINDRAFNEKHVGSRAVRAFIEKQQPMVCFTGHIHEGVGIDVIGKTQIVNPGPLWRGGYAYAEINGATLSVEIRKA